MFYTAHIHTCHAYVTLMNGVELGRTNMPRYLKCRAERISGIFPSSAACTAFAKKLNEETVRVCGSGWMPAALYAITGLALLTAAYFGAKTYSQPKAEQQPPKASI
jgi:hypothetical protein